MGDQHVAERTEGDAPRASLKALLDDVTALERLMNAGRVEAGVRRIGAEQEMFLVDEHGRPAPVALEVLERAADSRLVTEIARFNLEANLTPQVLDAGCLRRMEAELCELLRKAEIAARASGARVLLTGILPTLRKADLGLENMTPRPRYLELNRALSELRSEAFHVRIHGIDELETAHDNLMLESCTTSFQVHFQVSPAEFAASYNLAQLITAPLLAAAVNSPVLLRRRLWHETRVALFERSVDTRSTGREERGERPRVQFGDAWVQGGALDIFREDIARFRVVLASTLEEDPIAIVSAGGVPELHALRLHNGTCYRWNRPCYGVSAAGAHLRIENRVMPAGPTAQDEMANAAFFVGMMAGLDSGYMHVDRQMRFEDVKANFFAAARHGLKAQLTWIGDRTWPASELLLGELLPAARAGLGAHGVDEADVDRLLGTLEERVRKAQTGAQWVLGSLAAMGEEGTVEARHRAVTLAMLENQRGGAPVHTWPHARLEAAVVADPEAFRTVGQLMSTDLFTVRPEDIVDFAASVMEWRHVRQVPVEDARGTLVGLVSQGALLRLAEHRAGSTVGSIMQEDPVTVTPETPTLEAIRLMREHRVGCLPVVEGARLVGIVTEHDMLVVSARLLERFLGEP